MFSSDQSLRAFGAGRNALRQMHATLCVEREGDQKDEVFLRACYVTPVVS